ncbi:hypothetical protein BGW36DRAFT_353979 [Talaromyces proteolyticus]|uniref:Uncharacterized protein n=1 Tax=Talaromyces proteolyticus TaxID=1131652 RepID=A0AAD4L435_9EURO|nr:uncharacterized protein BGW36DRAFT_353979 [Talaromyces proteolyticus]KAH8705577.1 hypothetical protein BGW36DRAFT_353979 [Talaromyces proteolyticus]
MGGRPEITDQSTHKLVRAHVMRKYKRDRRKQKEQEQSERRRKSNSSQSDTVHQDSTASNIFQSKSEPPETLAFSNTYNAAFDVDAVHNSIINFLPAMDARLNPVHGLSIPATPRVLMLLSQGITNSIRTSVHSDPTNTYKLYCMGNPAWTFMSISYSAARLEVLKNEDNQESAYYLSRSRSAMNEIITTSPNEVEDSTIVAVSCLSNIACLSGSVSDALVHINGLQRMVELRGGLNNLGLSGITRRMVQWSDLLCSATFQTKPRLPRWQFENMPPLSTFLPETTSTSDFYEPPFNSVLKDTAILSNRVEVLDVLKNLHELTTFLNLSNIKELPFEAAYPDRLYGVEHKVLCLIAEEEKEEVDTANRYQQHDITRLLLRVSLLYIYTNLRQTPIGGKLRRRLVKRLQEFLNCSTNLPLLMATFPAEMLWTSFLGSYAATGTDYQSYFIEITEALSRGNSLLSWAHIISFLNSLPVLEDSCRKACNRIWMDNIGTPHSMQR